MQGCYCVLVRTTLDIDDSVLAVAREKARREGLSLGRVVSDYALRGIHGGGPDAGSRGVPVFTPPQGDPSHTVTLDLVERHRDGDE
ncbi:Putative antitoxin VapB38 [Actinomyces israelii]|nr:Putative antitoxin VapB38 [Actinomyces israelii]